MSHYFTPPPLPVHLSRQFNLSVINFCLLNDDKCLDTLRIYSKRFDCSEKFSPPPPPPVLVDNLCKGHFFVFLKTNFKCFLKISLAIFSNISKTWIFCQLFRGKKIWRNKAQFVRKIWIPYTCYISISDDLSEIYVISALKVAEAIHRQTSKQRPNHRQTSKQRPNHRQTSKHRPNHRQTSKHRPNHRQTSKQRPNLRQTSKHRTEP